MSKLDTFSCSYVPCQHGHGITFWGDPGYELPNGYPCDCGQKQLYWQECPECGAKKMMFLDRAKVAKEGK